MNHPNPENPNAEVRSILLPTIKLSLELKNQIAFQTVECRCVDCVSIRTKFLATHCELTLPESARIITALIAINTDAALDLAGTICYASGEAFHVRADLEAKTKHVLEQSHAYLRSVIEAKRLLLWFHEELHQIVSPTVKVASFPLHTEDGIIRFDKDTRMRVKAAAVEFVRHAGLTQKE